MVTLTSDVEVDVTNSVTLVVPFVKLVVVLVVTDSGYVSLNVTLESKLALDILATRHKGYRCKK